MRKVLLIFLFVDPGVHVVGHIVGAFEVSSIIVVEASEFVTICGKKTLRHSVSGSSRCLLLCLNIQSG